MQVVPAFIDESEVTVPPEIVQHESQALHFLRRQARIVDVEYLAGAVRQTLTLVQLFQVVLRRYQRNYRQRLELFTLRLHFLEQTPRLESDVGQRPDGGGGGV